MAPEPARDATKIRRKEIDLKPNNQKFHMNSHRRDLGRVVPRKQRPREEMYRQQARLNTRSKRMDFSGGAEREGGKGQRTAT